LKIVIIFLCEIGIKLNKPSQKFALPIFPDVKPRPVEVSTLAALLSASVALEQLLGGELDLLAAVGHDGEAVGGHLHGAQRPRGAAPTLVLDFIN
jgi:hypothetical protein